MRIGFCCKWLNNESEFGGMKVMPRLMADLNNALVERTPIVSKGNVIMNARPFCQKMIERVGTLLNVEWLSQVARCYKVTTQWIGRVVQRKEIQDCAKIRLGEAPENDVK